MSSETLSLNIIEYPFKTVWNYSTIQTNFESGHVQTRARWRQPRRHFQVSNAVMTVTEMEGIVGFYRDMRGPADSFSIVLPGYVVSPYIAATLGEVTGSDKGARTRYAKYTWANSDGDETLASQVAVKAVTALYKLTVTVPEFPAGVTRAYVYEGTTSAVLHKQTTPVTTSGGMWTEPAAGFTLSDTDIPTANALTETVTVHFLEDSLSVAQVSAIQYAVSFVLEELF